MDNPPTRVKGIPLRNPCDQKRGPDLEGPQYAARRAELRREAGKAARARDRQAAVAMQNEAGESGATEEEATGGRTSRVGRPRGGMRVAARIGDRLRREIGRGRRPRVGDG